MVHWSFRRKKLCDPNLCNDRPEDAERCDKCPLTKLEAAEAGAAGSLVRRAMDLKAVLNLGVPVAPEDFGADELFAILIIDEEREKWDEEQREQGES